MISWRPRAPVSDTPPAVGADEDRYEILIEREVISSVHLHAAGSGSEPRFGFLLGHLHRCPESGLHYSAVEVAAPAAEFLDEDASGAYLLRAWSVTRERLGGYSGLLLGWYHTHRHLGMMLSQADLDTGRRYFGAPWQVSVIVVPDPDRPMGGVFRVAEATESPTGARPMPFYELLDAPPPSSAPAPTAVNWTNYESDRSVRVVPLRTGRMSAPFLRQRSKPAGAGDEPTPRAPGVPLVIPAAGAETGLLPPRSRHVPWPLVVVAGLVVVLALVFLLPSSSATSRNAGSGGRAVPVRSATSPEEAAFLEDVEELELATVRYRERAGDFEAGRIGCEFLATGYVAADEAYFQVAASYKALGTDANAQAVAAYDEAGEAMAGVNTHFDASGCPRP